MKRLFLLTFLSCILVLSSSAQWTKLHTGLSANSSPLAMLEVNQKLLLGYYGLYASTDGGANWDSSCSGLPMTDYGTYKGVQSLVKNGSITYAAVSYDGVYKSSNDGVTWSNTGTGLPANSPINCMMINNNTLFVGMDSGRIYRSTDNGDHWNLSNSGIDIGWKQVLAFTANSAGMYASTYFAGVFFSSDNGDSWTSMNNGLPANPAFYKMVTMGNDIYASSYGKLFKTTDNAASWTNISSVLPVLFYGSELLVHGTSLFIVVTIGNYRSIYRSTDNGGSWASASSGLASYSAIPLLVSSGSKLLAYGVKSGGGYVLTSTNDGDSWVEQGSYPLNCAVSKLAVTGNYLLVGTHDAGLLRTSDNGNHWETTSFPTNVRTLAAQDSIVLASYYIVSGVDSTVGGKSTDYGATWTRQRTRNGLPNEGLFSYGFCGPFVYTGTSNNTGASGIYRSSDLGETWTRANTGISSIPGATAFTYVGTTVIGGITNILGGQGVYTSTNNGSNWTASGAGLPTNSTIQNFALDGTTIYATIDSKGIYKSTDVGANWTDITPSNANTYSVGSIITVGHTIFATFLDYTNANGGVYVSTNGGSTWITINEGLSDANYFHYLAANNDYIFVSGDNAIYKRPVADFVTGVNDQYEESIPGRCTLEQNYPNPFNPVTLIKYSLSSSSHVSIKVYNMLGEEVATLVNGMQMVGNQSVSFDASALPSGVYLYKLQAGDVVDVKKLVLMK